jgi:hypothetical protein
MTTISTTFSYNGTQIKVEDGRVFALGFGTTIYNHSMHHSWIEINKSKLNSELKTELKERGLI